MTAIDQRGKYGRYIHGLLTISDLVLVNLLFLIVSLVGEDLSACNPKIVWLMLNVSFLPVVFIIYNTHKQRAIYMEHVFTRAIQVVGIHAVCYVSLLTFLSESLPVMSYVEFYVASLVALPLWWLVLRQSVKRYRRKGRNFCRVVIVGTNSTALRLQEELMSDAGFGYKLMGFFGRWRPADFAGDYKGDIEDLDAYVKSHSIDEIYFTLSGEDEETIKKVTKIADDNVVQFYYVPQISRYVNRVFELHNVGAVSMLTTRNNPLKSSINRGIKRAFDILFSSLVLLILFPFVFIPVAIIIKITSPGPIFFKQMRTGYRGRDFMCWKFRTMHVNADSDKVQATKDDPRKTKFGDFLRRSSIDELPQFINVFMGDMSVVGPRPHMLKHTEDYSKLIDKYMVRHLIKPGITGWAQVNGYRGLTEALWQMERRVEYDVWYIENWTFLLDLKIIVRTVLNAIQGEKNAF